MFLDFDANPLAPQLPLEPHSGQPGGEHGLLMDVHGTDYRVPAMEDEESATFTDEEGMSILADTDGDGRIDYVSHVTFDGQWSAWRWNDPAQHALANPPENATTRAETWHEERWICVERGEWG